MRGEGGEASFDYHDGNLSSADGLLDVVGVYADEQQLHWRVRATNELATFVRCPPYHDIAALESELVRLEQRRQAAYMAGDRAELEQQFAAEYIHTNLRGGQTDRTAELNFYGPGTFSLGEGRIENISARSYGDVATMIATVTWIDASYRPNPAISIDLSGRYSVSRVYVWREDRWQLALSHASQIPEEEDRDTE
ncbi:MAG: nuclear transport factor 2 family protein [Hyphomonadaceae bacterium]